MKKRIFSSVLMLSLIASLITAVPVSARANINIGDYIQMGTYYGEPILWRCVSFEKIVGYDDNANPIMDASQTSTEMKDGYLPLMFSDKIICLKAFDAAGDDTSGSHGRGYNSGSVRKKCGSNYWADSNIRCWLNSRASAGNVVWTCGNPPDNSHMWSCYNEYDQEAGFLTNFSVPEILCIKKVTQDSLLDMYEYSDMSPYGTTYHIYSPSVLRIVQNAKTTAYREQISDSIFLLDVSQINKVYQNDNKLDGNNYYIGIPTTEAIAHSEYQSSSLTVTNGWEYLLRSPHAYNCDFQNLGSTRIRHIHSIVGDISYSNSYTRAFSGECGVRPAFFLDIQSCKFASGNGTEDKPYTISNTVKKVSNSTTSNVPVIKSAKIKKIFKDQDILTQTVKINKGSTTRYDIKLDIDWKGIKDINKDVYLTQGASNQNNMAFVQYNSMLDSFENVPLGTVFETDKPIYIIAVDKSDPKNKSSSIVTKLKIIGTDGDEVYERSLVDGKNFKFGKDIELNVPEDVPIFGGTKLTWKLDFIPITVESNDGKMNIVFGLDLDKDGKFSFDEYKKSFNDYVTNLDKKDRKQNRTLKQLRNDLRMSEANKRKNKGMTMSMWDNKVFKNSSSGKSDTGIDVMGYAIAEKGANGWELKDGYICFEATVSYTYKGQVFIYVIPCYYSFKGSLNGEASAEIKDLNFKTFEPKFQAILEAGVGAEITGGVGVPQVAGLDATGKGSLNVKMDINNFEKNIEEYLKVYVDASASFGLTLFGQKVASKEAWHLDADDGIIYSTYPDERDKSWIKPKNAKLMSLNSVYDGYDANKVYENESRDYLDKASTWVGNRQKVMLMSAGYSNKNPNRLANNIYPNSKPQICDINGTKVLIFIADNTERTAQNKQMLVYSVYNESNNTWSEPQPIYDDGTADFYPSISGDYIVWQNQKTVMGDNLSLADIGKQGEIAIAKWNGNGFDTPVSLTDNNELDTLPKIAVNGDNIAVYWVKNTDNDILGISGTSSIVKKTYNGSNWSDETVVKQNLNSVIDLSVGYSDDKLYIAYIPDGDGDISTIDDREIYLISDTETKVTDNEILDSHPIIDNGKIYWYSESNIYYRDLDGVETQTVFEDGRYQLAEGFSVSENNGNIAILWSGVKDDANEIMGVLYQNGEWGDVIEVSDLGGKAKYPTSVLDENGRMLTAFTSEIDDSTNLYTIDLIPSYDIAIDDVRFNESGLSPNSTNEIEVTVKNAGELPIESYNISAFNEDGTLNKSTEIIEAIKAGETKTVTAYFETGDEISLERLTVKLEIENDEYDVSNNETTFEIGHADIELSNIESYELLPTSTVTATIENIGFSDAENITISLRNAKEDGEALDSKTISSLVSGESQEISFEYKPKNYDDTQWYITVETETEEISKGNNSDYFINECALNLADFEHSVLNCQYSENTFSVNSFAINNTEKELNGTVFVAIYDKSSRLKKLSNQSFTLPAYSDTGVDTWVENYEKADGDIIKVFVWDGLSTIRPLTEAEVISQSKWIIE